MPIQVKIILDSGTLLEDDGSAAAFAYAEVGTFKPKVNIYADGELAWTIGEEAWASQHIEARRVAASAEMREVAPVTFASELLEHHLVRLPELYPEYYSDTPIDIDAFDRSEERRVGKECRS